MPLGALGDALAIVSARMPCIIITLALSFGAVPRAYLSASAVLVANLFADSPVLAAINQLLSPYRH